MTATQSELTVIVKAKDLCSYVLTVTEKSPKRFRFTLVAKLQGYALNTIENLCRNSVSWQHSGNTEPRSSQSCDHENTHDTTAFDFQADLFGNYFK